MPELVSRSAASARILVVDRFEGDTVVVETEDGQTWDLPRWLLPPELAEGDVVSAHSQSGSEGAGVHVRVDPERTRLRRTVAERALQRLEQGDPGGDITL